MAKEKEHVCKQCGYMTTENKCANCGAENSVADKPKGLAVVFNMKESQIGEKLNVNTNGKFALKY
ncbi:MAG: transcription elongation factor subunit Spt4 [Nanoarchaeota archaeon]|nr:transcription elongation factor subunit Spt4 [Nanoarchaeota archaeon]